MDSDFERYCRLKDRVHRAEDAVSVMLPVLHAISRETEIDEDGEWPTTNAQAAKNALAKVPQYQNWLKAWDPPKIPSGTNNQQSAVGTQEEHPSAARTKEAQQ